MLCGEVGAFRGCVVGFVVGCVVAAITGGIGTSTSAVFRRSPRYFSTASSSDFISLDSFFDAALKYAMIAVQSSSLAGKVGMRMPANSLGRICSTFLKNVNSQ